MTCYSTTKNNNTPISSSDVDKYDGEIRPFIVVPTGATLNDFLLALQETLEDYAPPTEFPTEDIILDIDLPEIGKTTGDTLAETLTAIDTIVGNVEDALDDKLDKGDFLANSIIKADAEDTPIVLEIGANSLIGRNGSGVIESLNASEVLGILNIVNVDSDSVFPYNDSLPFSVGEESTGDKDLLVVKEGATFADNPRIKYVHDTSTIEFFQLIGKLAKDFGLNIESLNDNAYFVVRSNGAQADKKDQEIHLGELIGATYKAWKIKRDGSDSNNLKFIYYNGSTDLEVLEITKTGLFTFNGTTAITGVLDEDDLVTDSATHVPTQQSVKAYVDDIAVSQTEMDATQSGAGLGTDGSYTAPAGSTYLTAATSLFNADETLDIAIKAIDDRFAVQAEASGLAKQYCKSTFEYDDLPITGTISLATIPDDSIIDSVRVKVITAFTDDGSNISTLEITTESSQDIKTDSVIGTDFTTGVKSDTWYDFDFTAPILTTADRDVTIGVKLAGAATALTAGKLEIYVEYFI